MMRQTFQMVGNMGWRYILYRIKHELEKRTGILKRRHPVDRLSRKHILLSDWRRNTPEFLIPDRSKLDFPKLPTIKLQEQTQRILKGEILFFSHEWRNLGENYDWITNPESNYQYDISKHWSEISDLNPQNGDIKYVWEKSRFSYLLTIIRNDYHLDEDHSEFVFSEIDSWINGNPINKGPNWRCSQETSLRIMNWCYALYFYKDSVSLTSERWDKIQNVIYWSLHHVFHHIDFSRIAVRNNHAITETLFLSTSELLFPFIPETKKWAKKGRKWFEQEIAYQIYEDGTFLQFSMNYHRVVVQLLSFGIVLSEKRAKPFSKIVYERSYKSLDFLYQCLQEENGYLPNSGSNDGALFFPLSNSTYRDYRPQLNTLHKILTGKFLYDHKEIKEDYFWLTGKDTRSVSKDLAPLEKKIGPISYDKGGYYLIREINTFTFIRCGAYKDRPNQSDNLHIDIWYKGVNILRDSGSYKYNTDVETIMYFRGCKGHNTLSLAGNDQMLKGNRFIWYYWVKKAFATITENKDSFKFEGRINAFRQIQKNIWHFRSINKRKNELVWEIRDFVENSNGKQLEIFWQINPEVQDNISIKCKDLENNILAPNLNNGWYSGYYGLKEPVKSISFKSNTHQLETTIKIKNEDIINTSVF